MSNFLEVFKDVTKLGTKIPTNQYLSKGKYQIIDQGQNDVAGFTDIEEGVFTDVPVIAFGDHTRVIKYVDKPCFLGADGVKLLKTIKPNANYKYLYYVLLHAKIPDTGYNRHFKWLKEIDIPLYNPEIQKNIVNVLDKVTDLIDKHKKQLEKLDELVKARFVEMFGDSIDIKQVTINDVCSIITDGTHQPPKFQQSGIPFIFVSNIIQNKITYDTEKFISDKTYNELIKRTPIEVGDILLSTVGSYGHPAIVKEKRKFLFQRHIAYLKPKYSVINSNYLYGAILSHDVQRQIEEKVKGVAQKTLNLGEIKKIVVPLPKVELQNQFADFVKQVEETKAEVQKSLEKTETLKKALMQKYFG